MWAWRLGPRVNPPNRPGVARFLQLTSWGGFGPPMPREPALLTSGAMDGGAEAL